MSQADIAASLRAAARQEGASLADAVPAEPVSAPASEPASEPTAAAEPEPQVAAAPEPTPDSPAEPEPAQTPAQASEPAQSFDLAEVLKSTGYDTSKYGSPQEALSDILAQMRRTISEQGEKLKTQTATQPSTTTPQTTAAAQPQVPAPPAPAAPPVAEVIAAEVKERLKADNEVTQALTEFRNNEARIEAIRKTDIPKIQQEIARLEAWLPENAKSLGLPEPDEVTAANAASRIRDLQAQFRLLRLEAAELSGTNNGIRQGYQMREAFYKREIEGRHQEALRAEQEEQSLNAEAEEFVGRWKRDFAAVIADLKITDDETKADIWNRASDAANARPAEVGPDLRAFIARFAQEEQKKADKYRRDAARSNAIKKEADTASQAPVGPAAVASPRKPNETGDPFAALRAAERARYQSGASA